MPDENLRPALLQALKELEDHRLENHRTRSQNYSFVYRCLENEIDVDFDHTLVDRILKICAHDVKVDLKHITDILNIVSVILKKIKADTHLPSLVPLALGIIKIIKATSLLNTVDTLNVLCVETLLLFPDELFVTIATDQYDKLMELFDRPGPAQPQLQLRVKTYYIIHKLLTILPSERKTEFVKGGISVWLQKVIPTIVTSVTCQTSDHTKTLDLLEALTDELLSLHYTDCAYWPPILECICNPNKYPQIMKNLLETGSSLWHRMWIVFIRLLNNQITRNTNNVGTPINSMLPVVETAFKMDTANRCKAFQCWSVLIDIFSKETNENCITKRLKLLVIPLRLNNAKVDETAMAKFEAWWHLITKFQTRLDKFIDTILIAFLHFCFGKYNSSGKTSFIPGQLSTNLKKRTVEAFVEIVGHVDCEGCSDLPRLKNRLINTKYLVDYWNDWAHSLKTAMKISVDNNNVQHVTCLWKSFLHVLAQLPDSNVKRGVFVELLTILGSSLQDCRCENLSNEIVFNILITTVFEKDLKLTNLLKPNDFQEKGLLNKIISIVLEPSLKSVYQSLTTQEVIEKLKPLTDFIIHESSKCSSKITVEKNLCDLPSNDTTLMLWTALADTICNYEYEIGPKDLCYLLQWPLKSSNMFTDVHFAAKTWYKLYDLNFVKLSKTDIEKHISRLLLSSNIVMHSSIYFTLCAVTAILKNGLSKNNSIEYEKEAGLMKTLLNRIDDYKNIEEVSPMLIDTLVIMLNNAKNTINDKFAEATLMSVKVILKLIIPVIKQESDLSKTVTLLRMLLKSIESLFEVESYFKLHSIFIDNLNLYCVQFEGQLLLKDVIQSLLKKFLKTENKNIICDSIDLTSDDVKNDTDCKFTTPNIKDVPKKVKRKEMNIINTVVENGEEFVVVKSNWKFNPRKLTENQKEKLQRKREDIPALYQDLSQSQDEFKMQVWKTDSQDNSTTSKSSSKSINEGADTSDILKNLNSSDVVPKIIENILAEKEKKDTDKQFDNINNLIAKDNLIELKPLTPKTKKTPRMALKDRVFRNVRNLIEKSTTCSTLQDQNASCNQIEAPKTPLTKAKHTEIIVNSAPSLLLCDRPSRVKRKPRKFDDTEIFAIKKRRHSQSDSQINNEELEKDPTDTNIEEVVDNCRDKENKTILIEQIVKQQENLNDVKVEDLTALEDFKGVAVRADKLEIDICVENVCTDDNETTKSSELPNINLEQIITDNDKEKLGPDKEIATITHINVSEEASTPKHTKITENDQYTPSVRKSSVKKSRIEKELAIDMVEGHPFLNTPTTSEKRKTRKNIVGPVSCIRRKNLSDKLNKLTKDSKTVSTGDKKEKGKTGIKDSNMDEVHTVDNVCNSPESTPITEESCSEDIIESSQDSTLTTITVTKKTPKKFPVVSIEKMQIHPSIGDCNSDTQSLLNDNLIDEDPDQNKIIPKNSEGKHIVTYDSKTENNYKDIEQSSNNQQYNLQNDKGTPETCKEIVSENLQSTMNIDISSVQSDSFINQESKDDTELPRNETAIDHKNESELTENMDTAPLLDQDTFDDVIVINDDEQPIVSVSSDENIIGPQTQEIADADTQANEIVDEVIKTDTQIPQDVTMRKQDDNIPEESHSNTKDNDMLGLVSTNNSSTNVEKSSDVSSPLKDDVQRKKDFLNNTIEISPIKTVSPDREKKSPSPDSSSDYVVIKLSSPVHSNGEPFEKGSPEFFTEEKTSPDTRDQSPPRTEVTITNTSPSSSLSLKKNRPQVRSGGRAAQMLGLCVPDKLNPLINLDRIEVDEGRKNSPSNTPARRNLRILYNSVGDNSDNLGENEENENFLKLKRSLPGLSSSPSGPILKRKLAEITDDTTVSPANKRKRVSFHDPPVSTTISVQKYIEPCGVRSPQNSVQKRQERQARMQTNLKSQKRLDNLFTLDSVLTKTVESFTDVDLTLTNTEDTQITSLDATPAAEIVKTSELNDTDPICPQLLDCKDPIDIIAAELSSPAMKSLLIKELEDKVTTVGDLAKMTEFEVNRLCIKTPKVKIAKKVLAEYAITVENKKATEKSVDMENVDVVALLTKELKSTDIAVQTNELAISNAEIQTCDIPVTLVSTQTEMAHTSSVSAQTDESGNRTTAEIIQMCLLEKSDFLTQLSEQLQECSIQQIANKLSFGPATDVLMTKIDETNSNIVLDRLLGHQCRESNIQNNGKQLAFLRDYLCDKFESKDLILFCSELLKKMYEKPA